MTEAECRRMQKLEELVKKEDLRNVTLVKLPSKPYGFSIFCSEELNDYFIKKVTRGSVAEQAGLKVGDYVVEINNYRVSGASTKDILEILHQSHNSLNLVVINEEAYRGVKASPTSHGPFKYCGMSHQKCITNTTNGADALTQESSSAKKRFCLLRKVSGKKASAIAFVDPATTDKKLRPQQLTRHNSMGHEVEMKMAPPDSFGGVGKEKNKLTSCSSNRNVPERLSPSTVALPAQQEEGECLPRSLTAPILKTKVIVVKKTCNARKSPTFEDKSASCHSGGVTCIGSEATHESLFTAQYSQCEDDLFRIFEHTMKVAHVDKVVVKSLHSENMEEEVGETVIPVTSCNNGKPNPVVVVSTEEEVNKEATVQTEHATMACAPSLHQQQGPALHEKRGPFDMKAFIDQLSRHTFPPPALLKYRTHLTFADRVAIFRSL